MQRCSLLSPLRPPPFPLRRSFLRRATIIRRTYFTSLNSAHPRPRFCPIPLSSSRAAAVSSEGVLGLEGREEDAQEAKFVEVGYISSTHGIKGELRVTPATDFPELRFCTAGTRWLRTRISGKELISEVQLTSGRAHAGQKCWIVSFSGIDTVDKAKQIVGSTLLVRDADRPDLEEGEFYTRDLVGMRVILKESGTYVGMVTKVVNYGASDLLQVTLTNDDRQDQPSFLERNSCFAGQHVWVPFVEAIVPEVYMDKREILITPPKGLLELNLRSDTRSKKERRLLVRNGRKERSYNCDLVLLKRN
ncbi:hypothetical protein Cni_G23290 [Canna indica]|uniref:Uncharacterized protein n=1 Tax=Canna indica TaxID=4628 RepID=A0AAQ3KU44_9LILI|nr:hypothetical protein Cni_G23290 [Canna indica]